MKNPQRVSAVLHTPLPAHIMTGEMLEVMSNVAQNKQVTPIKIMN